MKIIFKMLVLALALLATLARASDKGVQVNVFGEPSFKDEGNVTVGNSHLVKRSVKLYKVIYKSLLKTVGPPLYKKVVKTLGPPLFPPLFKKLYPPTLKKAYKKLGPPLVKFVKKPAKSGQLVTLGTVLGGATIGGGAIGASTLGVTILGKATLGAGGLGAGALGAATLGAGALGTAAVAGTAGVAGMWCMTKTYSNFKLCQISNITVLPDKEGNFKHFLTRWSTLFAIISLILLNYQIV